MRVTKIMYTIPEAAEATGIGKTKLYELMGAGQIESVTVGRSRYIPADALEAFVAGLRRASAA